MTDRVAQTLRVLDALDHPPVSVDESLLDQVTQALHDEGQLLPRNALALVVHGLTLPVMPPTSVAAHSPDDSPLVPSGWRYGVWRLIGWLKAPWVTLEAWLVRTSPHPTEASLPSADPVIPKAPHSEPVRLPHRFQPANAQAALDHWETFFLDLRRGRAVFAQADGVTHPVSPVDRALLVEAVSHLPPGRLNHPVPSPFDAKKRQRPLENTMPAEGVPTDWPLFFALLDLGADPDALLTPRTTVGAWKGSAWRGAWQQPSLRQWLAHQHQWEALQAMPRPMAPVLDMSQTLLAWALLSARHPRDWIRHRARVLATVTWIFQQEPEAHAHHVQVLRTMASRGHPLTEPVRTLMRKTPASGKLNADDVGDSVAD